MQDKPVRGEAGKEDDGGGWNSSFRDTASGAFNLGGAYVE